MEKFADLKKSQKESNAQDYTFNPNAYIWKLYYSEFFLNALKKFKVAKSGGY